jgi:DNA-binding MarR family transcriptional regulator
LYIAAPKTIIDTINYYDYQLMPTDNNKTYSVQLAEITATLFANCQEKELYHTQKYKVSMGEFRCIKIIHKYEGLTVNEIAQKMLLTSSRVSRIIDQLVKKQFVHRLSSEHDRRIYNISLTQKGKTLANKLIRDYDQIHEDIMNSITSKHHKRMIEMLEVLNDAVEKWLSNR